MSETVAPYLFVRDTTASAPAAAERTLLEELERDARALDAMEAEGSDADADVAARRRVLLARLDAAGLFEDRRTDAKLAALAAWSLPALGAYARAALDLHGYYRSVERAREVPDAVTRDAVTRDAEPPIVGGPVSLDWFRRRVPTPAPYHPYAWLGWFEHLLRTSTLRDTMAGEQLTSIAGHVYHFRWRREDGNAPALTWATRR